MDLPNAVAGVDSSGAGHGQPETETPRRLAATSPPAERRVVARFRAVTTYVTDTELRFSGHAEFRRYPTQPTHVLEYAGSVASDWLTRQDGQVTSQLAPVQQRLYAPFIIYGRRCRRVSLGTGSGRRPAEEGKGGSGGAVPWTPLLSPAAAAAAAGVINRQPASPSSQLTVALTVPCLRLIYAHDVARLPTRPPARAPRFAPIIN